MAKRMDHVAQIFVNECQVLGGKASARIPLLKIVALLEIILTLLCSILLENIDIDNTNGAITEACCWSIKNTKTYQYEEATSLEINIQTSQFIFCCTPIKIYQGQTNILNV